MIKKYELPKAPGIYLDRRGDPWRLENGRWYGAGYNTGPATTDMAVLEFLAPFELMKFAEDWRTIDEFPDYEVSDNGNIRNSYSKRIMKQRTNKKSVMITLPNEKGRFNRNVARLVAVAFLYDWDPAKEVRHLDGNTENNNVLNLRMSQFNTRR